MCKRQHHRLSQTAVGSPTGTYELSSYELLTRFTGPCALSCGTGHSHTSATPVTVGCMSCLVGRHGSSQDSQLGKTDNGFSSPAACVAPPAVWKLTRGKEQVYLQFHFSMPHNQAAHCLHQYSLPSGSGGKAKGMRIGRSYVLILSFYISPNVGYPSLLCCLPSSPTCLFA